MIELVMCWDDCMRELHGSLFDKASLFVNHGCIHYIGDEHWFVGESKAFVVLPLNQESEVVFNGTTFFKKPFSCDYNKRVKVITVNYDSDVYALDGKGSFFHCNCQGWSHKQLVGGALDGVNCCHCVALKIYFKNQKRTMEG